MTRSIFDPTGTPEESGSRRLGPEAKNISHLPPEFTEDDKAEAGAANKTTPGSDDVGEDAGKAADAANAADETQAAQRTFENESTKGSPGHTAKE